MCNKVKLYEELIVVNVLVAFCSGRENTYRSESPGYTRRALQSNWTVRCFDRDARCQ